MLFIVYSDDDHANAGDDQQHQQQNVIVNGQTYNCIYQTNIFIHYNIQTI